MKKWKLTFIASNYKKEVVTTETITYTTKHNAELAAAKQMYDMFLIGYDHFEVTRKGPNEISMVRHIFRGYDINYVWTIEGL